MTHHLHEHMVYAYQHSPAVRNLFEVAGINPQDIHTATDLQKLPITTKDELIEMQQRDLPFGGWLAVPLSELSSIYISPGPLFDTHHADSIYSAARVLGQAGFDNQDITMNTFMYHLVPAGMLFHDALIEAGSAVVPMGPGNLDLQVQVMMQLRITGYVGTPSFLAMILDKALELGIENDEIPLKKAFFSAEYYPNSLRMRFEGEYGMRTAQAYATADLGVIAYQLPDEEGFVINPDLIVELVDPKTGEHVPEGSPGEVVVTSFSKVYPLTRFGTGDMAIMLAGKNRLQGLVGRSGEAVKVRGMFLHPNQINFVLPHMQGVSGWEAIVTREGNRDHLKLNLLAEKPDIDAEQLKHLVKQVARVTVDEIEFVSVLGNSGKVNDLRKWD